MDDAYARNTREAYRSRDKAEAYDQQIRGRTWMRFAMWREVRAVRSALSMCSLSADSVVLDMPCGTGILGEALVDDRFRVIGADISLEMIRLARPHYASDRTLGFVNADALELPFGAGQLDCVVALGFLHRLPPDIRKGALQDLTRVCRGSIIASFSFDTWARRMKLALVRLAAPRFASAPSPVRFEQLEEELASLGWRIVRRWDVAPLLSSESVLLLKAGRKAG